MVRPIRNELDLGARLRAERVSRSLTQAQVARAAGVSRGFVTELERGKRPRAELNRVLAVISALDLTVTLGQRIPTDFESNLAGLLDQQENP